METENLATNRRDKYKQVYDMIYSDLLSRKYSTGQKIPNAVDLARQYNVSRPTITRAIAQLETKGILIRKQGSGTFVANDASLTTGKLGILAQGLKVEPPEFKGFASLFGQVISHIARASHGTEHVLIMNEHPFGENEQESLNQAYEICRQLINMSVRGVFFVPFNVSQDTEKVNSDIVNRLTKEGINVTLIDRDVCERPHRSHCDLVEIDNRRAGYILTSHIVKSGCKNIIFITAPSPVSTVLSRIKGYYDALEEYGISPKKTNILHFNLIPYIQPEPQQELKQIKDIVSKSKPDAFICSNDRLASVVMRNLLELGIKIPGEISVAGFDGEPFAQYLPVPLTTMSQPVEAIGTEAFRLMKNRINNPKLPTQTVTLQAQLVVRKSCVSKE